jgi:hypothetical protein
MPSLNVFDSDAFGVVSMTDAINKVPFTPGLIGSLGIFEEFGITTTSVLIEEQEGSLSLIPVTPRGAPAVKNKHNKRTARALIAPHLALEDEVQADEVQNVRAFGSETATQSVMGVVNGRLAEMAGKMDATLEHMRIGALKGQVLDADGSTVLLDLFTAFGVSQIAEKDFNLDGTADECKLMCHEVWRNIRDELGALSMGGIWGLCSSQFFDALVTKDEVKAAYDRWQARVGQFINVQGGQAGDFLRAGLVEQTVFFGGILFQEYRGEVNGVKFVADNKAHFFPVGVPGLYRTAYAPADFEETVNTVGLPRYSKTARDMEFNRFVRVHTQSNPLNYVTRPRVLIQGKVT